MVAVLVYRYAISPANSYRSKKIIIGLAAGAFLVAKVLPAIGIVARICTKLVFSIYLILQRRTEIFNLSSTVRLFLFFLLCHPRFLGRTFLVVVGGVLISLRQRQQVGFSKEFAREGQRRRVSCFCEIRSGAEGWMSCQVGDFTRSAPPTQA